MSTFALWNAEVDTRPWASTQDLQLAEFGRMVERLRAHEVWAARLAPRTTFSHVDDLLEVPFTTKEDLRAAQAEADTARPLGAFQLVDAADLVQVTSSSGTTGAQTYFGLSRNDWVRWKDRIGNAYRTAGVGPGSVVALTTGMAIVAGGLPYADGIREAGGVLAWIGGQTTPRMAFGMDRIGVDVLVATASFASHFAERCTEELGRPARELAVRTVIAGGEPGAGVPHIRRGILDAWGATRVSEFMGLADVLPAMWAECEMGRGMHFTAAPDVLVELIDPATLEHIPWEPGATGEAVYTTLSREASAVVRFRSRDQIQVTGTSCACGRTAPTIRCVGRTDDMLIFKAMNVYPSAIRELVLDAASPVLSGTMRIRKSSADQVRFDSDIPLEVELRDGMTVERATPLLRAAEEAVRRQLRVRVRVEPLPMGVIPVSDYKNALVYAPA
ncbi:phenylacetate--CoA ligase [Agromyces sp. H66]|uniref:phenylacetate--CoA ligase family protein n=1 Tax=Agromyces sp. H66 TaxID=2529859 RepID=UPI0010AA13FA|nr:phenylacetate--CoA ligase [Agromyces sp. H66]